MDAMGAQEVFPGLILTPTRQLEPLWKSTARRCSSSTTVGRRLLLAPHTEMFVLVKDYTLVQDLPPAASADSDEVPRPGPPRAGLITDRGPS